MESNDKLEQLLRQMYAEEDTHRNEDIDTSEIIDEEWQKFEAAHFDAPKLRVHRFSAFYKMAASVVGVLLLSGIAYAAWKAYPNRSDGGNGEVTIQTQHPTPNTQHPTSPITGLGEPADSVHVFENIPLDELVGELATYYNKVADIQSTKAREVRLYYKWKQSDNLESVVGDLNHFEHVNLAVEDDKLVVKP